MRRISVATLTLLTLMATAGCSEGEHALGGTDTGGAATGAQSGTGGLGTGSSGAGGAATGGQSPVGEPELPLELTGATALPLLVAECDTSSLTGLPESLEWNDERRQITYENAHFRCEQDLCGYAVKQAGELRVLVQPCELEPESVAACDCLRNVQFLVPAGVQSVTVWRRWDRLNTGDTLVLIDSVDLVDPVPSCTNLVLDGMETDVDCGGAACAPCPQGMICNVASDCTAAVCTAGLCAVPTCTDAVQNGDETDVDCGGAACAPCTHGQACMLPADCVDQFCADGLCANPPGTLTLATFATDLEGFDLQDYLAGPPETNLYALSTLTRVAALGSDGTLGLLELEAPFDGYSQFVDLQKNLPTPWDMAGFVLHARIRVVSGFSADPAAPGGAYLTVKTGPEYVFARGVWTNLGPDTVGEWIDLVFDLDFPDFLNDGYDPTAVVSVGLVISTGSSSAGGPAPTAAVIQLDTFTLE